MKKYAKYPALAVTLAIMAVIFVLSSQPAELSTKVSRAVTETVQAGRIKAITPLWFSTTNLNAKVGACLYLLCPRRQYGRDRAAVAAPRYAAAKGTAGIGAVYAVRGR